MSETSYYLTLEEVSQSVRLSAETVITIVGCGIVEPRGEGPQDWLFGPSMIRALRRASRLQRDLELDWPAVALALDLTEQLQQLREDNLRLQQQLARLMERDIGG